jgi:ABC-type transporter Mla subunit MlaD
VIDRMERRSRRRRTSPIRLVVGLLAAVAIFVVGVAVGQALHDNPKPNLSVTSTKTLVP